MLRLRLVLCVDEVGWGRGPEVSVVFVLGLVGCGFYVLSCFLICVSPLTNRFSGFVRVLRVGLHEGGVRKPGPARCWFNSGSNPYEDTQNQATKAWFVANIPFDHSKVYT